MTIPAKNCWRYSDPVGWDEETAIEHFMGRSLEDAILLLEDNVLFYQEDFYYMPKKPFQFYIKAYIDYLMSEKSKEDSDAPSCFLGLVEYILDEKIDFLNGIEEVVNGCLLHVAQHQHWYDADVSIYGNFHSRVGKIRSRWPHA